MKQLGRAGCCLRSCLDVVVCRFGGRQTYQIPLPNGAGCRPTSHMEQCTVQAMCNKSIR